MKKHLLILGLVMLSCSQVFAGDAGPARNEQERQALSDIESTFIRDILSHPVSAEVREGAQFGLSKGDFEYDEIVLVPRRGGGYRYALNSIPLSFSGSARVRTSDAMAGYSISFDQLGKLPGSLVLKMKPFDDSILMRGPRFQHPLPDEQ